MGTARGLVRRIDDLGRVVIPKEIRRTLRIHEGDPPQTTLTLFDIFCLGVHSFVKNNIGMRLTPMLVVYIIYKAINQLYFFNIFLPI